MTKEINVAVIGGAGWIGGVHSECFIRLKPLLPDVDIKLHTIVDIQKESVKAAAEKYGFKEWSTDYNKVIETDEIDIVDICVNNNLHKDIAVKAAEAGKHIICEKPLSTNSIEGKEMCQAVEKNNVKNMINFNYRKIPAVAFIKEMINNGDIGNIYNYRCFIGQDFAVDPNMPITWRFKKETAGGGSLLTMGSHVIDLARYLAGEIEEVVGMSETFIKERPISGTNKREKVDVDDSTSFMAKFRNGAIGTFLTSWVVHGRKSHVAFEINGSKGTVLFNSERLNEIQLIESNENPRKQGFKNILIGVNHPYGELFSLKTGMGIGIKESFMIQFRDFINSIIEGKEDYSKFRDGLQVEIITEALQKSVEEKKWVKI